MLLIFYLVHYERGDFMKYTYVGIQYYLVISLHVVYQLIEIPA